MLQFSCRLGRDRYPSFVSLPCASARVCVCAPVCAVCLLLEFHSSFIPTCAAHCCKYNTSFLNWFRYPVQRSTWTFSIKVMQLLSRASYIQEFKSWSSSFCVCVSLFYCFSLRLAAPAATSAVSFLSSSSSWFSHINAMGGDKLLTLFFLLFFFGSVSWWSISIEWLTRTQIFFSFSFLLASRRQGGNGFWLIEPTNNCQLHLFIILKWNVRLVSLLGGWVGINSTWPKKKEKRFATPHTGSNALKKNRSLIKGQRIKKRISFFSWHSQRIDLNWTSNDDRV